MITSAYLDNSSALHLGKVDNYSSTVRVLLSGEDCSPDWPAVNGEDLVEADVYSATLAASFLTILLNAFLMRTVPGWAVPYQLALRLSNSGRSSETARTQGWPSKWILSAE